MANLYDLKKFDLNLLVIFECIYQHLSISKAAETLYITPSAVSQSLQRLRTQLNDPLFIRSGKGITPTTMGINLHHHLENNLNSLEQTINIMHETDIRKKFIIYGPQIIISSNVLMLIKQIRQNRNIEIEHHDIIASKESAEDLLAYRKADLVISLYAVNNLSIVCKPSRPVECVLICNKDHPRIHEHSSLDEITEEQFTMLMHDDPGVKEFQLHPDNIIKGRKIGFRSQSVISIANVIATTDIIGFIPKPVYDFYQPLLGFKRVAYPLSTPSLRLYYMYNRASLNNKLFAEVISCLDNVP
ncbi:DNA-binding transcriptional repressor CitR [Citrobacter rodentium]|uniref:Transcriptional regulator n=2 Tax=Citrobacter rodentium TaxID=67825 RepID=D2TMP4_CITRI|nr:LysR family transcriptional regulator [Citrobacter rodentium]KIQ50948.1 LysR family transcriptional regulator [Citrobacter rodentium]QBY31827.1 LysR family transcriptional regulator [Citrobacter rodentium]UHO30819.1 LysR family transcriptional regulator [Citrobacter rodentium NBRC 105723 = DSM 16636]CBG87389.1 transcriptional regulator [Citrobacter rodentium ICC168]HAT8013539.1 LysR family transcriptional regulator [Citrobacter rodentium NBRC 105723 = DSM 16636]